eukprot:5720669-Pyramimonas_sp.AAC.1
MSRMYLPFLESSVLSHCATAFGRSATGNSHQVSHAGCSGSTRTYDGIYDPVDAIYDPVDVIYDPVDVIYDPVDVIYDPVDAPGT